MNKKGIEQQLLWITSLVNKQNATEKDWQEYDNWMKRMHSICMSTGLYNSTMTSQILIRANNINYQAR